MLHARTDYRRIQDPATDKELCLAYQAARNALGEGVIIADGSASIAADALHRLVVALEPTLGLIITNDGIDMPAHPIAADEPVFVLRAADRHAPATVEEWAKLVYDRGKGDEAMSTSAAAHARRMRTWQTANGSKRPDAPADVLDVPDTVGV